MKNYFCLLRKVEFSEMYWLQYRYNFFHFWTCHGWTVYYAYAMTLSKFVLLRLVFCVSRTVCIKVYLKLIKFCQDFFVFRNCYICKKSYFYKKIYFCLQVVAVLNMQWAIYLLAEGTVSYFSNFVVSKTVITTAFKVSSFLNYTIVF